MQKPEFEQHLEDLVRLAKQERIAIMCAEAVPWRCHRSLIADALLVRGIRAEDIMSLTRCTIHALTPFAKVRGTTIRYDPEIIWEKLPSPIASLKFGIRSPELRQLVRNWSEMDETIRLIILGLARPCMGVP